MPVGFKKPVNVKGGSFVVGVGFLYTPVSKSPTPSEATSKRIPSTESIVLANQTLRFAQGDGFEIIS